MADASASPFQPFDAEGGLILATRLPGSPADFQRRRTWSDLGPPPQEPPLWIHLDRTKARAQDWVRTAAGVDPLVADALLAEETRPRIQRFGDGLLVILRGVNMNPGAEPDELIAIRMWLERTRVITLRQFRFQTIAQLRAAAQVAQAPRTAADFLIAVAQGLTHRMAPMVNNLEEMLDDIEDQMLERDVNEPMRRSQLATIRRQAISYRRYLVPQRDSLLALHALNAPILDDRDRMELRFIAENTARITEALEEIRDRAAVTQEELRARHESRVGRTLYLLTLVASIALPLSFITGLLGINVGGIPLADSAAGFAVICVALAVLAVAEVMLFKFMRWL